MNNELQTLLHCLEVKQVDQFVFSGHSPEFPPRIFGGQVLAQCLYGAAKTVDSEMYAHSMHGYFLRPGNPREAITFEIEPIRNGRSFATRRVVAKQGDIAIFNTSISFQVAEQGLQHQMEAPKTPLPEQLEREQDHMARLARQEPDINQQAPLLTGPFERRAVLYRHPLRPQSEQPVQQIWSKIIGDPGPDPLRHQLLLAYMSDMGMLGTALFAHPKSGYNKDIQAASLDHALWFHRPFRVDEYLLFHIDSPTAAAGRGFSRGSFYTVDGELVASATQESLIRPRP